MAEEFSVLVGIDSTLAAKGAKEFDMSAKKVSQSAGKMDNNVKQTKKGFDGLGKSATRLRTLLGTIGFVGVSAALVQATRSAMQFESAMAEVSTLLDGSAQEVEQLADTVKELSVQFGQSPTNQAKALYQVISAGAENAAEAQKTLTAANKLAVGGLTSVETAADGLTSIMNAYGESADATAGISDAMFVAMKAGKTTIEELSASVGRLAPLTAATGISIDEMLAATSALTTVGLSTSESMNGLKAALSNILKPSKEAAELAGLLGVEFNAAALESKGLTQFMQELAEAADGDTEVITELFGSVEAMNVAMALASEDGGAKLVEIMDDMANKAGATETAFDKMSATAQHQADVLKSQLAVQLTNIGTVALNVVTPALTAINDHFNLIVRTITTLGAVIASVFIVRMTAAAIAMIRTATAAGVLSGSLATLRGLMATLGGPVGVILIAVTALLTWTSTASAAESASDSLTGSLDNQAEAFRKLGEAQQTLALQGVAENLAEADAAVRTLQMSVNHLEASLKNKEAMGDPIEAVAQRLLEQRAALEGATASQKQYQDQIARLNGVLAEQNEELQEIVVTAKKRTIQQAESVKWTIAEAKALADLSKELNPLAEATAEYQANQKLLNAALAAGKIDATKYRSEMAQLNKEFDETAESITGMNAAEKESAKLRKSAMRQLELLRTGNDEVQRAVVEHRHAIEDLKISEEFLKLEHEEQLEMLELLRQAHERNIETLENACEKTDKLVDCNSEASGEMSRLWDQGLRNIQDSFADAFRNIFDSSTNFFDGILDAFKDMIANMLATWAASGVMDLISGNGIGGLVEGFGGLKDVFGSILGNPLGQIAVGAGVGQLGGGLTGASDTVGSVGGAIGSIVGSAFGPIGSLIGGFLGGAIGGALFGGKKTVTGQGVNLGISGGQVVGDQFTDIHRSGGLFRSSKRSTSTEALGGLGGELQSALDQAFGAVGTIAGALGVSADAFSSFNLRSTRLDLKGLSDEEAQERIASFLTNAIGQGIEHFVRSTDGLSDRLRNTVLMFTGNADDMIAAFEAAAAIDLALTLDPVQAAAEALALQQSSLIERYQAQRAALDELVEGYDGSIGSLQVLAQATEIVKRSQAELAQAFLSLKPAIADLFGGTAQSIKEALLNEEQLFDLRQSQVDELVAQLNMATDPADIARISDEINALTLEAFGLLDEGQQADMQAGFLTFLDEVIALANERIDAGVGSIVQDQADLELEVSAELIAQAAEIQAAAADRFGLFVDEFGEYIRGAGGGLRAEVNLR